jgi:hypothetical protein
MRKAIIVLMVAFTACGGGSGWSDAEKDAFLQSCESSSGGNTEACKCGLEKAQELAENPEDISTEEATKIGLECR